MARIRATRQLATVGEIERAIHVIRGRRVILDSDLAKLYGVKTAQLNQQVARNKERFPEDFAYRLTQQEFRNLISQIVLSSSIPHSVAGTILNLFERYETVLVVCFSRLEALEQTFQIVATFFEDSATDSANFLDNGVFHYGSS
jgi:hypothetical protein